MVGSFQFSDPPFQSILCRLILSRVYLLLLPQRFCSHGDELPKGQQGSSLVGVSGLCLADSRDPAQRPQSPRSTEHHSGSHGFPRHPQAGSFRECTPAPSDLRYRLGSGRPQPGTRRSGIRRGGPVPGPAPDVAPPRASAARFVAPCGRRSASCWCCGAGVQPSP